MKNEEENDDRLIGPSPNEILAQGIEDIKSLSLKRQRESERKQYDKLFKQLASLYFQLTDQDIAGLTPKQKISLEFALNQKAKRYNKIWLWTNIIGLATIGVLAATVNLFFLSGLFLLVCNCFFFEDLTEFRSMWKTIYQTEDPKKLLEETEGA